MLKELQAAPVDLYIDQGDTYYKLFTIRDNTGAVVNLTGLTVDVVMRRYSNTTTTYPLTAAIVTPSAGTMAMSMTSPATTLLVNDRYVYSVRLSDATDTAKIMFGQVLVTSL